MLLLLLLQDLCVNVIVIEDSWGPAFFCCKLMTDEEYNIGVRKL